MQISLNDLSTLFFQDAIDQEFMHNFSLEAFATKNELFLAMHAFLAWKHQGKKNEVNISFSPTGFCPLYSSYHFHWPALPYLRDHQLLARVLFALGKLSGQEHLKKQADKMLTWQNRWVDHQQKPLLLFTQKEHLLDGFSPIPQPDGLFYEENLSIVLQRKMQTTLYLTSSGCKSSMGAFLHHEIGVVAFGPKLYPLEDLGSFGIVTHSYDQPFFSRDQNGFSFQFSAKCAKKGAAILPDLEDSNASGLYLSFKTKFEKNHLQCDFDVPQLLDSKFAFCFYAKAARCRVKESHILHPRSLDHYQGPCQKVEFLGKAASMRLQCSPLCQMEVIPLGEDSLMKSDFLVIYTINQKSGSFSLFIEEG